MYKILKGILFTLLLCLAGVVVFIYTLDLNKYKTDIELLVSKNAPVSMKLNGPLSLQLLPNIQLHAANVALIDGKDNQKKLLSIKEVAFNINFKMLWHIVKYQDLKGCNESIWAHVKLDQILPNPAQVIDIDLTLSNWKLNAHIDVKNDGANNSIGLKCLVAIPDVQMYQEKPIQISNVNLQAYQEICFGNATYHVGKNEFTVVLPQLTINHLDKLLLKNIRITGKIEGSMVSIHQLKAFLGQGQMNATGHVKGNKLDVTARFGNINFKDLPFIKNELLKEGSFNLNVHVSSTADAQFMTHAKGKGALLSDHLILKTVDIKSILHSINNIKHVQDLFTLKDQFNKKEDLKINHLSSDFIIQDSIIATDNLKIQIDEGNIESKAKVSLNKETVDCKSRILLKKQNKIPAFTLYMNGKWMDPHISFDEDEIKAFIVKESGKQILKQLVQNKKIEKVIGGNAGEIVGTILGALNSR